MGDEGRTAVRRIEGLVMPVNSYLVDGPDGIVVVDGQLTVADARRVRAAIDATGRPVAGMVLTHGHPDHYAGAGVLLDGLDAPIVATSAVAEVIERDDALKDSVVGPMMGAEWPRSRRLPDEVADPGAAVRLGGLELTVRPLGPGESHADTLWALDERIVFSGDVAYDGMHAYLADGRHGEWIRLLTELEAELAGDVQLHPGHGAPTDTSVLARQRTYVEAFVEAVDAHRDEEEAVRHDAVVARLRTLVPGDALLFLAELSIEPVRAGLATTA
jgi:glyoxylase-like metal-dependent hydrolase (beta-lactamase superfamily II)